MQARPITIVKYCGIMSRWRFRLGIAGLFFAAGSAWGQAHNPAAAQRPEQMTTQDTSAVQRGAAEFKASCGFCHGPDATGGRGPDLVRSAIVAHDDNGNLLGPTIRNGRPDKGMPSFANLKEDQLTDIVAFLHHQAHEAAHSANVPGDYPLRKLLTGNAEQGKAYFYGAGGCSGCHSVDKDLKGIAAKYSPIDLQQAMVYPSGPQVPKTKAVVTMKDGQRFEGTVLHADDYRIGIQCQDGWYRSWNLGDVDVAIHDPLEAHRKLMNRYTDADIHNLFAFLETLK